MPELPEVETTVRQIRPALVGRRIVGVRVHWPGSVSDLGPLALRRALVGSRIEGVSRRGKFFILDLARNGGGAGHLIGHLRMSGRLRVERETERRDRYARVELILAHQRRLVFADVRKFGRLRFTRNAQAVVGLLGPEPLAAGFTRAWLADALRQRRRRIKPLLLDQAFIAGLGNIYTDEALFAARIHPQRSAHALDSAAVARLHASIRRVLAAAIRREGTSFDTFYRTPEGRSGRFQERLLVYGRAGAPCRRCGAAIARIVVAQRGTHICPRCQRAPRRSCRSTRRG